MNCRVRADLPTPPLPTMMTLCKAKEFWPGSFCSHLVSQSFHQRIKKNLKRMKEQVMLNMFFVRIPVYDRDMKSLGLQGSSHSAMILNRWQMKYAHLWEEPLIRKHHGNKTSIWFILSIIVFSNEFAGPKPKLPRASTCWQWWVYVQEYGHIDWQSRLNDHFISTLISAANN